MEGGEGMVAVVRGLRDSGLAVTLLDGTRQYTLVPNAVQPVQPPPPTNVHITQQSASAAQTAEPEPPRSDSAAQATDGRYASMYKMAHCRVAPTSPPVQLTEFPPQRAELCRGQGNFEVGGSGSGENYTPCRSSGSFRGAMSWPDRGSVCSPRPSREPDAFANSLRKYPSVSVERSTELVERLITYTQAKNISKSYQSRYPSPSRHGTESNTTNLALDRNTSRNTVPRTSYQKNYEPEVNISSKAKPRVEESPTRDLRADYDGGDYRRQVTRAENKYLKDITRKVKENIRGLSCYPYNQPVVTPVIREAYEQNNLSGHKTPSILTATNSVNMEVQAAAEMVSKEVATVPRTDPSRRNVAVPLSPTSSSDDQKPEGDVSDQRQAKLNSNTRTYKSANMPVNYSVQATSSSINKENLIPNCHRMVIQRKTKSDEIVHKDFGDEMFDLLEKVSVCPNTDPRAYDLRLEVLKQMSIKLQKMTEEMNWNERNENTKEQIGKLLKFVPLWIPSGDIQAYREAISDEIISRMSRYRSFNVYRTETHSNISNEERNLDDILRNWIRNVPFKSFDIFGKPIEKDDIVASFLNRLKRLIQNRPENDSSYLLKLEMVNIISKLPIPANDLIKSDYLNDLAESLLMKLRSKQYLKHCGDKFDSESDPANQNRIFRRYIQPTEKEVRDCISDELKLFLETCSRTNSVDLKDIEIEIIDYIIDSIQAIRSATDRCVESELIMLLCQEIENITWYDARKFVQKLLVLVKNMFSSDTTNQDVEQSVSNQTQSYVVFQNTANSRPHHKSNTNEDFHNSSDFSIGAISKADIDANLDAYMDQLTSQIDQWLASLPMQIPQAHDSGFRQVVVHDLAGDILDRHKYLELNPSSRGSDADQLEHLKYQIFKWINKLVGEDNMNTIEHAPALMQRIQSIPVPMLAIPQQNITGAGSSCPPNGPNVNSMPGENNINTSQIQPMPVNKSRLSISQAQPKNDQSSPSMKKLNEEYDVFVKKWVQEIPIPTSTPEEKALADKARMGIYNGVWKAITKLKFEPATFDNPFYYEDALDDELEELLSALPKSSELETKKHLLKVQLIEKTTNTSDLIKSTATPSSYRQQLVENVSNSLPHKTADKEDPKQALEQVQILRLVEDFILFANYKDIDKAKANVYRKKLIQEAQILVDNLKTTHGKELQDIDTDVYINSIFNVLHKVPLPKEETIKDEADEIMLGAEVENWLSDLPAVPNNDGNEQMQRKKLKDALVKRIREIEKDVNILDRAGESVLKHEISSFLEKVPMQQGENVNITFMADEFANRLKNRAQQQQSGNATRKSVAFMDSVGYCEFSQNMPFASSFSDLPGARPAVANQSSYMIRDGTRVPEYNYYAQASFQPQGPLPSEQYFTLEDSQATPKPTQPNVQPQMQPQPMQEQNQYSRMQNYKSIPAVTYHTLEQSVAPNMQSYNTIRETTAPPIQSAETQQSPFCKSAAGSPVRHQTIQGMNQSGPAPRLSIVDQFPPAAPPVSMPDIPPQAQTPSPSCARNQGDAERSDATRNPVTFMDSAGYYEFSQQMPHCSSFSDLPGARPAVANQSSYMIRDGTRVPDYNYYAQASFQPQGPLPSEEYFTLEDSQATPKPKQPQVQPNMIRDGTRVPDYNYYAQASFQPQGPQPQPMQEHNQYSRMQNYKSIPAVTYHTMEQSVAPNAQSYHTIREATAPPIQSLETQQSPSAAGSPVRRQTIQGMNQSGPAPRPSIVGQFPPAALPVSMPDIPPQAQTPCCATNQGDASRIDSPTRQRAAPPTQTGIANPEGVIGVSQFGQSQQVPYRSPERNLPPQSGSFRAAEQQQQSQQVEDMRQTIQQTGVPRRMSTYGPVPYTTPQQLPLAQSPSYRAPEQQQPEQVERKRETVQQRGMEPGQMSTYGPPQFYSTPQQVITQGSAPRVGKKRARNSQRNRRNLERRRLDLEDDTEEGFESEVDEPCQCMERMMRCRRPPVCFAYEDFEMDQCYPVPYGSLPMVTNNFTVQLCGDVRMRSRPSHQEANQGHLDSAIRNIKSVQTSFSSVDLMPTEKCCNCRRKIKSQEDLRNKDGDIQLQNEVLDWLKETGNGEPTTKWGEKMQKLAQKLAKPGGEEKIRQKIQKYLTRVPLQFSECDEERREFRERLPETIIKKLKRMYLKLERTRNHFSPVRIFRIEIPKEYYNVEDKFKGVIKNWLNEIPLKKRDFLGRGIKKEDVLDSVVNQLEPYILNRDNFDKDYRSMLKASIIKILNEMPIEIYGSDKTSYFDKLALSLINDIICIDYYTETPKIKSTKNPILKEFVLNQIADILNKLHLSASTKRLKLLEEELTDSLNEVIHTEKDSYSDATKDNIFTILHKLGGLSDYQANYFTDVILKQFKEKLGGKLEDQQNPVDSEQNTYDNEVYHSDTYSVFHNTAKTNPNISKQNNTNTKDLTINDEIKTNIVFYKRRLIVQIQEWLNELQIKIPFDNKDKAIKELAGDIIDRFKYTELNPASRGTDENELQYLKYQVFKWINKVVGETTMETIENAHELMKRIRSIGPPYLVKTEHQKSKLPPTSKINPVQYNESFFQLKQVITDCLNNIPNNLLHKAEIADDLASNIIKQIETNTNIESVINTEIERWMKNVCHGKHIWVVKDKLKQSLQNKLCSNTNLNIDSKKEKILVRKYEDAIDELIDDLAKMSKEVLNFPNKNQCTHDLAVHLYNLINGEESHTVKYLEDVTLKWFETCLGQQCVGHDCVSKLVDSFLDFNNEMLFEINREDQEKAFTSRYRINNESNSMTSSRKNEEQVRTDNKVNIAVYGVTLASNPRAGKTSILNNSIKEINDDDVQAGLDLYLKQLVEQIDAWLSTLDIPQIHDTGFREIVVNDLAGDIIDRHKYLELNPSSRGSDESELEQLKYQIFKWINKLVGEDQHETVQHAPDLMNRIQRIPVPLLTKHSETPENKTNTVTNRNVDNGITKANASAIPSNVRLSSPLGFTTGPMATTNKQNVVQMSSLGPQVRRPSLPAKPTVSFKDRRLSGPPALGIPKTPTKQLQTHAEEQENLPQGLSLVEVHQYFDKIFQNRIKEIPLETPTPEQEALADLARQGIHNGIWKTYLQLKADPEIENDYAVFEMVFEDQLDKMLDCLPQTKEMQKIRQVWKIKVLADVLNLLKSVHSMTDRPTYREMIAKKFDRQYIRAFHLKQSNLNQHICVESIANNFILHSKYKEEDPVKAKIYKQRLMKKVDELVETVKSQANVEFGSINKGQLISMAMDLLKSVPIPHDETLADEVEEILVAEEIDQWYNGLPTTPLLNETDGGLRKRMRELLAKKLCEIEKRLGLDESAEQNLRHEISKFLQQKAILQKDADLGINFMVEELANRLKNRRQQNMLGYESFEKEKPMSSSFVQTDPGEVFAPLIDAEVNAVGPSPYELTEGDFHRDQQQINQSPGTSQVAGFSNQLPFHQSSGQTPASCCQGQGILGTSQMAGPSGFVPIQGQMNQMPPQSYQGQGMKRTSQTPGLSYQIPFQERMSHAPPPRGQGQDILGTSQVEGRKSLTPFQEQMSYAPQPCHQDQSIFGTSQVAGPTSVPFQQQMGQPSQSGGPSQGITGTRPASSPRSFYQQPIDQMPQPFHQGQGILGTSHVEGRKSLTPFQEQMSYTPQPCHQDQSIFGTSQVADPTSVPFQQQMGQPSQSGGPSQGITGTRPASSPRSFYQQPIVQMPQPFHQGQGILGTSQVEGRRSLPPFQEQMNNTPQPCHQEQSIFGTSQVAGPTSVPFQQQMGQPSQSGGPSQGITGTRLASSPRSFYQQPIDQMPQPFHQGQSVLGPAQGFPPPEGFGNQSYHEPVSSIPPDRSFVPPNIEPCAPNLPASQIGPPEQMYQGNIILPPSQASIPPSTDFLTTQDPTPTAATRSTARVASSVPDQGPLDEETDGEEEVRYKCRCMERVWKCKKRRYYEGMDRQPRCYPMPFPCRYFY